MQYDTDTAWTRGKVVVWHEVTEARKLLALKDAEHLKDEFIAMAAHELKTPMASVKGGKHS